jgi:hypothetical protein
MSDFSKITAEEIELIRIMSKLPEFRNLETASHEAVRHEITHRIAQTLQEYYWENTRNHNTDWTDRFRKAGISEDDGKSAISCARRLGVEIS